MLICRSKPLQRFWLSLIMIGSKCSWQFGSHNQLSFHRQFSNLVPIDSSNSNKNKILVHFYLEKFQRQVSGLDRHIVQAQPLIGQCWSRIRNLLVEVYHIPRHRPTFLWQISHIEVASTASISIWVARYDGLQSRQYLKILKPIQESSS